MWGKEYDVLNKLSDDSEVKILKVSDRFPSAIRNLVSKLMGAKKLSAFTTCLSESRF